jgi:hypothetical protein
MTNHATVIAVAFVASGLAGVAVADEPKTGAKVSFSGHYHVKGTTTEKATHSTRAITGTVILVQQGDAYTATFDLETNFPTVNGPVNAQVIGKGSGKVDGRTATGSAETQLVLAEVPGVDPGFAFLQPTAGPRLVSKAVAKLEADGTLVVEIENEAAPGEKYAATHTTLTGQRMHEAGSERWERPEE